MDYLVLVYIVYSNQSSLTHTHSNKRMNGHHPVQYAVVCPNVTGRTKERIAQSKRARAGSLALVD